MSATPPTGPHDPDGVAELAGELRLVVGRLVRRFRRDGGMPQPQLSALGWLVREGPRTTSQLAALEQVRPQSMAQTVGQLEAAGLIERRPDPGDGRQAIVALTDDGRARMAEFRAQGESWVAAAVQERLAADEVDELRRGLVLLARLLDEPA